MQAAVWPFSAPSCDVRSISLGDLLGSNLYVFLRTPETIIESSLNAKTIFLTSASSEVRFLPLSCTSVACQSPCNRSISLATASSARETVQKRARLKQTVLTRRHIGGTSRMGRGGHRQPPSSEFVRAVVPFNL